MIKKIFVFIVFMLFITLPTSVKASTNSSNTTIPTISQIYTEGFYNFDNIEKFDISVTLTQDIPTKIIILDEEINIDFMSGIPYNYKFYLRNIDPGSIIGIVGQGEVAITFEPSK